MIFVQSERHRSNFTLLYEETPFAQCPLFKRLAFLQCLLTFIKTLMDYAIVWANFWILYPIPFVSMSAFVAMPWCICYNDSVALLRSSIVISTSEFIKLLKNGENWTYCVILDFIEYVLIFTHFANIGYRALIMLYYPSSTHIFFMDFIRKRCSHLSKFISVTITPMMWFLFLTLFVC